MKFLSIVSGFFCLFCFFSFRVEVAVAACLSKNILQQG